MLPRALSPRALSPPSDVCAHAHAYPNNACTLSPPTQGFGWDGVGFSAADVARVEALAFAAGPAMRSTLNAQREYDALAVEQNRVRSRILILLPPVFIFLTL